MVSAVVYGGQKYPVGQSNYALAPVPEPQTFPSEHAAVSDIFFKPSTSQIRPAGHSRQSRKSLA
jgi:hypothetical protein